MPPQKLALDGDETCAVDLREGEAAMSERSIFMEALEFDNPRERAAFLDQACAGDEALRQRIERLLRRHQQPDSLLDAPAAEVGTVGRPTPATPAG